MFTCHRRKKSVITCATRSAHAKRLNHRLTPSVELLEDRTVLNAGLLDPTFGNGGLVTTDVGGAPSFSLHGAALQTVANETKILVADTEFPPGILTFEPALYRYNSNGTLDQSFGFRGRVALNLGPPGFMAFAKAVAVLPSDNSIYVVGYNVRSSTDGQTVLAVEHLNANGTIDVGFGQNGVVHQDFNLSDSVSGLELVLQSDGKLVVGGSVFFSSLGVNVPYVARLNPDGSLDSTFLNTNVGAQHLFVGAITTIHRIAVDSHDRIVVTGESDPQNGTNLEFSVSVLSPDGTLDNTFDGDGRLQESFFGPGSAARAVVVIPGGGSGDEMIAVGNWTGTARPTMEDFAFAKYAGNGRLAGGYGQQGIGSIDFAGGDDEVNDAVRDASGDLLIAGEAVIDAEHQSAFALARVLPSGHLDPSFGPDGNGTVTTSFGDSAHPTNDDADVVLVQPDGKIVLVGKSNTRIALARYLAESPAPSDSDGDGVNDVVEDGAAHQDGNGDNMPDRSEAFVASLPNAVTQSYLTLVNAPTLSSTRGGGLKSVTAINPAPPAFATLPAGALSFTAIRTAGQGAVSEISLALPSDLPPGTIDSVYAFGPTPDDPQPHWYRLPKLDDNDNLDPGARIFPDHVILNLVDGDVWTDGQTEVQGGFGDNDLKPDGWITAEIAPAVDHGFTGRISGTVFHDANANGYQDAKVVDAGGGVLHNLGNTEEALAGWKVYLDTNQNGRFDAGEPLATTSTGTDGITGPDGTYQFAGLDPRTYTVAASPPSGQEGNWINTAPGRYLKSKLFDFGGVFATLLDRSHDGYPDLVLVGNNGNDGVGIYSNNKDGTFTLKQVIKDLHSPAAVAVLDLNGDGLPDLAVTNTIDFNTYNGEVVVYLGQSDGSFLRGTQDFPVGQRPLDVEAGDVDGDGIPDLVTADYQSSSVSVLLGKGDGTFKAARQFQLGSVTVQQMVLGQFNPRDDNFMDVAVVGPFPGGVAGELLLSDGRGGFSREQDIPGGHFALGQFNPSQDNFLDLAVSNDDIDPGTSSLTILANDGHAAFHRIDSVPVPPDFHRLLTTDLNGDGWDDLFVVNANATVRRLRSNGDGTFTPLGDAPVPDATANTILAADVTGDRDPDMIFVTGDAVTLFLGNPGLDQKVRVGDLGHVSADFGNRAVNGGEIHGTVFNDINGNGTRDTDEPARADWLVFLDTNGDGAWESGEPATWTDNQGAFAFLDLQAGTYSVRAESRAGYTQTLPSDPGYGAAIVRHQDGSSSVVNGLDFGIKSPPGQIFGVVWGDTNGDGTQDNGELALAGVPIYLDTNNDGHFESGTESTVSTGADGQYFFNGLLSGQTYTVAIDFNRLPFADSTVQTFPDAAAGHVHHVVVEPDGSIPANFGITAGATIRGRVTNQGGAGIGGVTVYLDGNSDGQFEDGEPHTNTDDQGNYAFTHLLPGSYTVAVAPSSANATRFNNQDFSGLYVPDQFGFSLAVTGNHLIVGDPTATRVLPVQALGQVVTTAVPVGDVQVLDSATGRLVQQFTDRNLSSADKSVGIPDRAFRNFGLAVAALGDRIAVTANSTGTDDPIVAHSGAVFSGALGDDALAFHPDTKGYSVALQTDSELLGDPVSGQAEFVGSSGTPLGFGPPDSAPGDMVPRAFGESVAWLGDSNELVGDPEALSSPTGVNSGKAYLLYAFGGDRDFSPPTPESNESFGASVAAMGDTVLVGAPSEGDQVGAVYAFSGRFGQPLFSLTNPSTSDHSHFGFSLATLGDDILVGAPNDSAHGDQAGAVYLFDGTNGQLLQSFYAPTPQAGGHFGFALAAYGNDAFFVGAPGTAGVGAVFLVRTGRPESVQSGQTLAGVDFSLTLTPDFAVKVPQDTIIVAEFYTPAIISTTALDGFSGPITFTFTDIPVGIRVTRLNGGTVAVGDSFQVQAGDSFELYLRFNDAVTSITFPRITLTASSGSIQHTVTVTVAAPVPVTGDFELTVTPSTDLTLPLMGSATATIATRSLGNHAQSITFAVGEDSSGILAALNPSSVTSGETTTLTLRFDPGDIAELLADPPPYRYVFVLDAYADAGLVLHAVTFNITIDPTGAVPPAKTIQDPRDQFAVLGPLGMDAQSVQNPDPSGGLPAGTSQADFPRGFFNIETHGLMRGQHVIETLVLYYFQPGQSVNRYFKYGPTPDNTVPHWYDFTGWDHITDTGAEIVGPLIDPARNYTSVYEIILHLVDGQRGDDDLRANGVIVDPGGPAFVTTAIPTRPSERYVRALYHDLLGTDPEPSEQAHWVGRLDHGVTRLQVVKAIYNSQAHRGRLVDRMYAAYLHRTPNPAERASGIQLLRRGGRETALASRLLGSREYRNGHPTTRSFVAGLLSDVLGQPAKPGNPASRRLIGVSHRGGRAALAQMVLASRAAITRLVTADDESLLGRAPNPGELRRVLDWTSGRSDTPAVIVERILVSKEYLEHVGATASPTVSRTEARRPGTSSTLEHGPVRHARRR
jgi:uncharacterized delta-60 repeat protein